MTEDRQAQRRSYPKGVRRRQQILDSVIAVLAQRGVDRASLRTVGEAIGVSHTALRHYFSSRDELLVEAYRAHEASADGDVPPAHESPFGPIIDSAERNRSIPGLVELYAAKQIVPEVTNPAREISLTEAQGLYGAEAEIGMEIEFPKDTERLGRIAAQTAKQVIAQRVREAERERIHGEFSQRVGEVVNATVKRFESGDIIAEVGRVEAQIPRKEQSRAENYAIGDRVRAVMMPSRYTADISWIDARDMAARLGVCYDEIAIAPMFDAFRASLADQFAGLPEDATEENVQARVRGTLLMALSNKTGAIVLTTGNKSEMATGYCTLYGDMAGGFAVIKDVAKTLVYRLAEWKNRQPAVRADGSTGAVIPERIITRPPSAELRPDQTDQDSLPPYEVLDAILAAYMEDDRPIEEIVAAGFARADVERVTRLIKINEYKRRQAPVGIRITHRGFGRDWRYPITSRFRA